MTSGAGPPSGGGPGRNGEYRVRGPDAGQEHTPPIPRMYPAPRARRERRQDPDAAGDVLAGPCPAVCAVPAAGPDQGLDGGHGSCRSPQNVSGQVQAGGSVDPPRRRAGSGPTTGAARTCPVSETDADQIRRARRPGPGGGGSAPPAPGPAPERAGHDRVKVSSRIHPPMAPPQHPTRPSRRLRHPTVAQPRPPRRDTLPRAGFGGPLPRGAIWSRRRGVRSLHVPGGDRLA